MTVRKKCFLTVFYSKIYIQSWELFSQKWQACVHIYIFYAIKLFPLDYPIKIVWMCAWKLAVRIVLGGRKCKKWCDSEAETEKVENKPLCEHVPMGLPSAGLSWRLNFKKNLGYSHFSTLLLFHLSVLAQTMQPLTKPDTVRLVSL